MAAKKSSAKKSSGHAVTPMKVGTAMAPAKGGKAVEAAKPAKC